MLKSPRRNIAFFNVSNTFAIVIAVENAINTYDFYNTSEEIEERLITEMRDSYDCDA